MPRIEFYYDFVSPYSYLAAERLRREAPFQAAEVDWRPLFLGGVMQLSGNRPPVEVPNKGAYLFKDLQRLSAYHDIPFRWPPAFPVLTLQALRAALVAKRDLPAQYAGYVDAVFRAYWAQGRDISDPDTLTAVVKEAGLDPEPLLEGARDPKIKEQLKEETARAVDRGVFGAPSFFLGDELYWGVDSMLLLKEAAAESR